MSKQRAGNERLFLNNILFCPVTMNASEGFKVTVGTQFYGNISLAAASTQDEVEGLMRESKDNPLPNSSSQIYIPVFVEHGKDCETEFYGFMVPLRGLIVKYFNLEKEIERRVTRILNFAFAYSEKHLKSLACMSLNFHDTPKLDQLVNLFMKQEILSHVLYLIGLELLPSNSSFLKLIDDILLIQGRDAGGFMPEDKGVTSSYVKKLVDAGILLDNRDNFKIIYYLKSYHDNYAGRGKELSTTEERVLYLLGHGFLPTSSSHIKKTINVIKKYLDRLSISDPEAPWLPENAESSNKGDEVLREYGNNHKRDDDDDDDTSSSVVKGSNGNSSSVTSADTATASGKRENTHNSQSSNGGSDTPKDTRDNADELLISVSMLVEEIDIGAKEEHSVANATFADALMGLEKYNVPVIGVDAPAAALVASAS